MNLLEENGVDLKEVDVTILIIHKLKYSCLTKLQMNSFNVLAFGLSGPLSQNLIAEFMGSVPPEVNSPPNMIEGDEGENVPAELTKPTYQRTFFFEFKL